MNAYEPVAATTVQRKSGKAALGATFLLSIAVLLAGLTQFASPVAQAELKAEPSRTDLSSSHDNIKPAADEAPVYEYH